MRKFLIIALASVLLLAVTSATTGKAPPGNTYTELSTDCFDFTTADITVTPSLEVQSFERNGTVAPKVEATEFTPLLKVISLGEYAVFKTDKPVDRSYNIENPPLRT